MEKKAEFLEIFHRDVTRRNHDRLLAHLEKETDFFTAPASAKYHGAHPGGLVEHSLMCAAWVDEREADSR